MKDDTNESNSENEEQKRKKLEKLDDNSDAAQKAITAFEAALDRSDRLLLKLKLATPRTIQEKHGSGHFTIRTTWSLTSEGHVHFLKEAIKLAVPPAQYDRIIEKYEQMVEDFIESA